ncbi:MAG: hypothetical protein EA415_04750 [Sphaerobacteraceae bacterium]|nr:MAG: hypothetical protein EA415_04750 [Sphaerobacteraceae bacterium]
MSDKDIEKLIRQVRRSEGWRVERDSKHYKLFAPDGVTIITVSVTPSSPNVIKKVRSQLRRAGLDLEGAD